MTGCCWARGCLLMIDGLDEMTNRDQRGQVPPWKIDDLEHDIYPGNRVIVTAREAGYIEEVVFGDDFTRLDVQDLDEARSPSWWRIGAAGSTRRMWSATATNCVAAIRHINELRLERNLRRSSTPP